MSLTCSSEILSTRRPKICQEMKNFSEETYRDSPIDISENHYLKKNIYKFIKKKKLGISDFGIQKSSKKFKNKLKYVLRSFILPHIIGGFIFFVISYIDLVLPCDFSNFWSWFYRYSYEVAFDLGFYPFFVYHLLFPCISERMTNKRAVDIAKFSAFLIFSFILIMFQYLVKSKYLENFMSMHFVNLFVANLFIFIICKFNKIKFNQIKRNYFLSCLFIVFSTINHYLIKINLILFLKENLSRYHPHLFKAFLFLYFNGFRSLFRMIMTYYFKLRNRKKNKKIEYGITIFSKYFISDLMSSALIPTIVQNDDNYIIFFNYLLFAYQISIIYLRSDVVIKYIKIIACYILNIKKKNIIDEDFTIFSLNLFIVSLNELMPIMYFKIITIFITKKFLIFQSFSTRYFDSCLFFTSHLQIRWESTILTFFINIFIIILTQFLKDNNLKKKIKIKNKSNIMKNIFHILTIYFYVELNYEFYFTITSS